MNIFTRPSYWLWWLILIAIFALPWPVYQTPVPVKPGDGINLFLPLVGQEIPAPPPWCGPPHIPPDNLANEQAILDGINAQRSSYNLPALALAQELTQAARRHSRDMADNNFTSHTGSDGSNGGQRMTDACYDWSDWAEIIGWGFGGNPDLMLDWWMNSPTHRDIILSPKYQDDGAGYAFNSLSLYQHYWTVNFGKRKTSSNIPVKMYDCVYISNGKFGGSMAWIHTSEPCHFSH